MGRALIVAADDEVRDELIEMGEETGIKVIYHEKGADPCAVVYDGIEYAKSKGCEKVFFFVSPKADKTLFYKLILGEKQDD